MLPDLDQLIQLQQLVNAAAEAQRDVDAIPSHIAALDDRLNSSREAVESAKQKLDEAKQQRQAVEKELAEVQSRLSRFKEQLMAVKTNKEYTAMQHEIATAESEVQRLEDAILEQMLEADELTVGVDNASATLKNEEAEIANERGELESERGTLEGQLKSSAEAQASLSASISNTARRLFEKIADQRGGIAVVEAKDGHCSLCNVRLRPQIFNQILKNADLIQCDSCMRLLYHNPGGSPVGETAAS